MKLNQVHIIIILHSPLSFHNKLKCNPAYLDSKANKRIDYLLTVLLRVEEDMYFSRKYKDIMWKPNKLLTLEMERHYKAMKIEATQVNKV